MSELRTFLESRSSAELTLIIAACCAVILMVQHNFVLLRRAILREEESHITLEGMNEKCVICNAPVNQLQYEAGNVLWYGHRYQLAHSWCWSFQNLQQNNFNTYTQLNEEDTSDD